VHLRHRPALPGTLFRLSFWTSALGFDIPARANLAPTLVSIAGDRYPRQMGTVIGLLLSTGQTGSTLLPWITGRVAVSGAFRVAMLVPALAIARVAAGAMTAHLQRR
jgi:hypothetical protein